MFSTLCGSVMFDQARPTKRPMKHTEPYRNAVEAQRLTMAELRKPELTASERCALNRSLSELEQMKERLLARAPKSKQTAEPPALWTAPTAKESLSSG